MSYIFYFNYQKVCGQSGWCDSMQFFEVTSHVGCKKKSENFYVGLRANLSQYFCNLRDSVGVPGDITVVGGGVPQIFQYYGGYLHSNQPNVMLLELID